MSYIQQKHLKERGKINRNSWLINRNSLEKSAVSKPQQNSLGKPAEQKELKIQPALKIPKATYWTYDWILDKPAFFDKENSLTVEGKRNRKSVVLYSPSKK